MDVVLEGKYDCKINGNVLTGNTFPIEEFIKRKLDGKWDAERRVWIVNEETVQKYLDLGVIKRRVEETVAPSSSKVTAQSGYRKQYTHTRSGGGYNASGSWVSDEMMVISLFRPRHEPSAGPKPGKCRGEHSGGA